MSLRTIAYATLATSLTLASLSCSSAGVVGSAEAEAYDECGNGMDDDADGLIDEACPCGEGENQSCFGGVYPNRLVGACRDGAQVCDSGGGEFGRWAHCAGDIEPLLEACDGSIDDDCDGSIDEGCDCDASQPRECGLEFSIGPCQSGTQRCLEDSTWSHCEGAIGPSAELCSDTLDNDCDGLVNEGCDCVPSPEMCGDSVDNDCDGVADEGCDGCVPSAEVCGNGLDEDCDRAIDEDCSCTPNCAPSELSWDRLQAPLSLDLVSSDYSRSMWSGEGYTFLFGANARTADGCAGAYTVHHGLDGVPEATRCVSDANIDGDAMLVRMGEHLLAISQDGTGSRMHRLTLRGVPTGESVTIEGDVQAAAANGRELGLILRLEGDPFPHMQRFDFELSPLGDAFPLSDSDTVGGPERSASVRSLAWAGRRWVAAGFINERVGDFASAAVIARAWTLGDTMVEARIDLSTAAIGFPIKVAGSARGALACWNQKDRVLFDTVFGGLECQRLDGLGATAGEPFWVGDPHRFRTSSALLIVDWNCRYLVISPAQAGTRPDGFGILDASFVAWVDDSGGVQEIPRPAELQDSSVVHHWYFESRFGGYSAGPAGSPFMLRGRGANAGSNFPHSRVMLSCP